MKRKNKPGFLLYGNAICVVLFVLIILVFVVAFITAQSTAGIMALKVLLVVTAFVTAIGIAFYIHEIYIPMTKLDEKLAELFEDENDRKDIEHLIKEIENVVEFRKDEENKKHMRDLMEQKMKYAELQNQIKPHFLYNTLENIRGQAIIDDNYIIADMTEALSRFFRYNINKDNDVVKLSDELENIRNYIKIQQYRFRDRFTFRIVNEDNTDAIYRYMIPKMTLQPIVENAIYHGIEEKIGQGHIDIHIESTNHHLIIVLSDDGVGIEPQILKKIRKKLSNEDKMNEWNKMQTAENNGDGIAMENVNKRLKLLFGEEYGIRISSIAGLGTEVEIVLPMLGRAEEDEYDN